MTSGAVLRALRQTAPDMAIGSIVMARSRFTQRGFTYLGMMFLILAIGIGLAKAGTVWQTEVQREKEKELLFIGEQYAMAIASYYESTPSGLKQYPASLKDLLQDNRFPAVRRHLRKLYSDPVTGSEEWGLVKQEGRITGVYSLSSRRPLKKAEFPLAWAAFAGAGSYAAWKFAYNPGTLQAAQQSPSDGGSSAGAFPPTQPGNLVSGGGETPSSQNSPAADPELGKKATCLAQRGSDMPACLHYCTVGGSITGCSLCQTSIASRYNACMRGGTLPPLYNGG